MNISTAGLAFIQAREGFSPVSYYDMAGVLTTGYGHTNPVDVTEAGVPITLLQARHFLLEDVIPIEDQLWYALCDVETNQHQLDAMISLAFNIGMRGFLGSTVLHMHKAGEYSLAANAFLLWDKAHINGALHVVDGLLNRRKLERNLYLTGDYALPPQTATA